MTERHDIFSKLGLKYSSFAEGTFTMSQAGSVQAVDNRPGLLVCNAKLQNFWTRDSRNHLNMTHVVMT